MTRPIIGLSCYSERVDHEHVRTTADFLPHQYVEHVVAAGGVAVLLPPQPSAHAAETVSMLDGLVVTGGHDVEAARYGQTPHPRADAPRPDRDAWEDALLGAAIEAGLPFLGICRGIQMLNVHRGGSLVQHLPDALGHEHYSGKDGGYSNNEVDVEEPSLVSGVLGAGRRTVLTFHHQAVDRPGTGLRVVARGLDGVIEAVELDGHPFGVAVQWHPEHEQTLELFEALMAAAERGR